MIEREVVQVQKLMTSKILWHEDKYLKNYQLLNLNQAPNGITEDCFPHLNNCLN